MTSDENNIVGFPITLPNTNYIVASSLFVNGKASDNNASIIEKKTNGMIIHRGPANTLECFSENIITCFK